MNRNELLRALRKIACKQGVTLLVDPGKGKGSHAEISFGDYTTTCPGGEINLNTLRSVLKGLGLKPEDLRR